MSDVKPNEPAEVEQDPRGATPPDLKLRLCVMMFLQYFVQGCYLPIVSVYLTDALRFDEREIGVFGSALAVGPLLAPFVIGQLVDRRFATQHVLAVCHVTAGITMLVLYVSTGFWTVVVLGTLYSVLYVPSIMLTNSLAFHHLADREREFPTVRVWGTIGFILPAWLIEMVFLRGLTGDALNSARGVALATAGLGGLVMAGYSLLLPHTPPARQQDRRFAPGVAAGLVSRRPFLVLVLVSFFVAIVHKFYFVLNGPFLTTILRSGGVKGAWEQRISSLGQIAEIAVMAGLGMIIARLGFKRTMIIGATAYLARCLVFAVADWLSMPFALTMTLVCFGQMLHGFCFGCFLAAAFMFLDRESPADVRGSVQNLYGTFVLGVGFFAGGFISGWVASWLKTGPALDEPDWTAIWLACAALAALCVAAFALFFPRDS